MRVIELSGFTEKTATSKRKFLSNGHNVGVFVVRLTTILSFH